MAMVRQSMNGTKTMLTMASRQFVIAIRTDTAPSITKIDSPRTMPMLMNMRTASTSWVAFGHEISGLLLVEEPEAHALQLPEELLPQVVGAPLRQGLGEVSLPEGKHPAKQAEQHYRHRQ